VHYHCQRCDDEITYTLDFGDFEYGLLCDECWTRHDKLDGYRAWCRYRERRQAYHVRRWVEDGEDKS
jgi:hypothetical protein